MDGSGIGFTVLIAALIAFVLYRRVRRNIGRQRMTPKRFILRICILSIVGSVLFVSLLSASKVFELAEVFIGLVAGAVVAFFGIRLTEFGTDEDGPYYVPNSYLGLAVSALLVGRLAYRLLHAWGGQDFGSASVPTGQNSQAAFQNAYDPVSSALLFIFIGYYVVYYIGVLLRSRSIASLP